VNDAATHAQRAQFSIQRTYVVSREEAWALWTTKPGIESWWGPEGFEVTVTALDLRVGGEMTYLMTAVAPGMVAFMKGANMPISTPCKVTYTEISAPNRLAYKTLTDFVPDVEPYHISTLVELTATGEGVEMTITFDAMHDEDWTERARAGHESQLCKLDALLGRERREIDRSDAGLASQRG
jgi:uncharacterized protein YndB with AHSA1/START domain